MSQFFSETGDWFPLTKHQLDRLWKNTKDNARNGSGGGKLVTSLRKQGFSENEIRVKANIKDFNITKDYLQSLWCNQMGRCADFNSLIDPNELFVKKSTFSPSIDRICDELGYIEGNVRIVFRFSNLGRQATPLNTWKHRLSIIKKQMLQ